jgi:hypothetical protein
VVDDKVQNDTHTAGVCLVDQPLHIIERAVRCVHIFIVADVVSHIDLWAVVHGTDPDSVDTNRADVVELRYDTLEIAYTIAVGILEGSGVDLIDDAIFPPRPLYDSHVRYVLERLNARRASGASAEQRLD